jgi:hypothetical protein
MSNVIELLEKMGSDARLRHAGAAATLQQANLDPALAAAILAGDQARLEALLGARTNVICGMAPAEEEQPSKDREEEEIRQTYARVAAG